MDDERVIQLFFTPPPSLVFILRLSFVIGGGPFLALLRQPAPNHAQTDGGASNSNRDGMGERTKASIPRLMSLPWASSALSAPPGWC